MDQKDTTGLFPISNLYENEQSRGDQIYLRQPINGQWHEYTWKQTMDIARRLANFFRKQGLKPGDRVAILSKNCAEWIMTDFAIMMAGLVSVPLYGTQHLNDIQYILEHSECKLIFVGKLDHPELQKAGIPESLTRVAFPYNKVIRADYKWEALLDEYKPMRENPMPAPQDLMSIIYTSGTTGHPKGVTLDFETVTAYRDIARKDFQQFNLPETVHFISYLPLAHIVERVAIEFLSLDWKSTLSFVESINTFAENLREIKPDVFFAVPRIWKAFQTGILAKVPQKKLDFLMKIPVLNHVIKKKIVRGLGLERSILNVTGAAPISLSLLKWFRKLGIMIYQGYGQTENMGYATVCKPNREKIGTVGQCRYGVQAKVAEDGELLIKSVATSKGYYREPELNETLFTEEGFLHTGDLGAIDEEGFLSIVGRNRDPFKTAKGEFVIPLPIEHQFEHNAFIEQCCLVGSGLNHTILLVYLSAQARAEARPKIEKSLVDSMTQINAGLSNFERVGHLYIVKSEWTVENHLLTPTLKVKRAEIESLYQAQFERIDTSHEQIIWED